MRRLVEFMETTWGRSLRIALGLMLIYVAWIGMSWSTAGIAVAVMGLFEIAMGLWGRCLLRLLPPQSS